MLLPFKNFVKDLCYGMELNGMGDKIQDYKANTNEKTKREDMKNVTTAWKKFQVVAVTGMAGAGIDFSEKHFDVTFAIIGCSSIIECQFQLIYGERHTNKNLLYLG